MASIEGTICSKNQSPVSTHFWTTNNIQQAIKWNLGINFYSHLLYILKSANLRTQHIFKGFGAVKLHERLSLINLFLNLLTPIFYDPTPVYMADTFMFYASWQQCPLLIFKSEIYPHKNVQNNIVQCDSSYFFPSK